MDGAEKPPIFSPPAPLGNLSRGTHDLILPGPNSPLTTHLVPAGEIRPACFVRIHLLLGTVVPEYPTALGTVHAVKLYLLLRSRPARPSRLYGGEAMIDEPLSGSLVTLGQFLAVLLRSLEKDVI